MYKFNYHSHLLIYILRGYSLLLLYHTLHKSLVVSLSSVGFFLLSFTICCKKVKKSDYLLCSFLHLSCCSLFIILLQGKQYFFGHFTGNSFQHLSQFFIITYNKLLKHELSLSFFLYSVLQILIAHLIHK